ncbi:hypothetical protein IKA92_07060, partial [bacterium]|nr:hypothetical protein [bacterium]
ARKGGKMVFAINLDSQNAFLQISKIGIDNNFCAKVSPLVHNIHIKKLCEYDSGEKIYSTN